MAVKRKVQFFLALTKEGDDGVRPPYDPAVALGVIAALPWKDRYDEDGERILRLWPRANGPSGMLGTVRRTALPPVDLGATIGDLGLGANQGIIEQTFFTVYDGRYVGVVRNQYGPRVARLADYLDNKSDVHQAVEFLPLLRTDTLEQLKTVKRLRALTLKVHTNAISELQGEDTIYEALDPARKLSEDAELIELSLSVAHKRNASLGPGWVSAARRLSRRADLPDIATKFEISFEGDDGDRHTLNILDDRLTSTQEIQTTSQRAGRLRDRSAYAAIDAAYDELADELATASGIDLTD